MTDPVEFRVGDVCLYHERGALSGHVVKIESVIIGPRAARQTNSTPTHGRYDTVPITPNGAYGANLTRVGESFPLQVAAWLEGLATRNLSHTSFAGDRLSLGGLGGELAELAAFFTEKACEFSIRFDEDIIVTVSDPIIRKALRNLADQIRRLNNSAATAATLPKSRRRSFI